jgi:hypothetical protein
MNHTSETFGFFDIPHTTGVEIGTAMLRFFQQIRQYQMDCVQAELADAEAATNRQKAFGDQANSQQRHMNLTVEPYFKLVNYWTGLTHVIFQGSAQMAMAVRNCGVDATRQLREKTSGVATPAIPNYMLSAMEFGVGNAMATLGALQHATMDNAHGALDVTEDHILESADGMGRYAKSGAQSRYNGRHTSDGAAA